MAGELQSVGSDQAATPNHATGTGVAWGLVKKPNIGGEVLGEWGLLGSDSLLRISVRRCVE